MANSVKFSQAGGFIILSASLRAVTEDGKKEILFSVQDGGLGVPESSKQRLFEPFYQADTGSTRKHGGNGLGLSISKRLAELMGGTMWFESQEGLGSTFYFTIQATSRPNSIIRPTPIRENLSMHLIFKHS